MHQNRNGRTLFRNRLLWGLPIVLWVAFTTSDSLAQQAPPAPPVGRSPFAQASGTRRPRRIVSMHPNSKTPSSPAAEPPTTLVSRTKAVGNLRAGLPWKVWVAYEGYEPKASPVDTDDSVALGSEALKFMDAYYWTACWPESILSNEPATGSAKPGEKPAGYVLLATDNGQGTAFGRTIGWVPLKYLVTEPEALKSAFSIPRKRLLINTVDYLKRVSPTSRSANSPNGGKLEELVTVRTRPDTKNSSEFDGPQFPLMRLFFEYGRVGNQVLIGGTSAFLESSNTPPREFVLGWIPADRSIEWNTRDCAEWDRPSTLPPTPGTPPENRRKPNGRIYYSIDDAYQAKSPEGASRTEFLIDEPTDAKDNTISLEFSLTQPRYPILDYSPKATVPGAKPIKDPDTGNRLLYLAGIGNVYGSDGKLQSTAKDIAELQDKLEKLLPRVGNQQIVILIDRTASMERHYEAVIQFVKSLADTVQKQSTRTEIAVSYYDDRQDRVPGKADDPHTGGKFNPLVPLTLESRDTILAELKQQSENTLDGPTASEEVFQGILSAIDASGFDTTETAARKLLIVIGDYPDKSALDSDGFLLPVDPKHPGESAIIERLLQAGRSPIEFYAIQVIQPTDGLEEKFKPRAIEAQKAFKTEMDWLVAGLNAGGKDELGSYATLGTSPKQTAELLSILTQRYDRLREDVVALQTQIRSAQLPSTDRKKTGGLGPRFARLLKDEGIDITPLESAKGGQQISGPGFVWEFVPGQAVRNDATDMRQIRRKLLMSRFEIKTLVDNVAPIFETVEANAKSEPLKAMEAAVKSASGDTTKFKSTADFLMKRQGIKAQSILLNKAFATTDQGFDRDEIPKLLNRLDRLKDILQYADETAGSSPNGYPPRSLIRTWRVVPPRQATDAHLLKYEAVGEAKPVQRFFRFPGNPVEYCWVDVEEEMP